MDEKQQWREPDKDNANKNDKEETLEEYIAWVKQEDARLARKLDEIADKNSSEYKKVIVMRELLKHNLVTRLRVEESNKRMQQPEQSVKKENEFRTPQERRQDIKHLTEEEFEQSFRTIEPPPRHIQLEQLGLDESTKLPLKDIKVIIDENGSWLGVERTDSNNETVRFCQEGPQALKANYRIRPLREMDMETINRASAVGDKYVIRGIVDIAQQGGLTPSEAREALQAYEMIVNGLIRYEDCKLDITYELTELKEANLTREQQKELLQNAKIAKGFGADVSAKVSTEIAWKAQDLANSIRKKFEKPKKALGDGKERKEEQSRNDNNRNAHNQYTEKLQYESAQRSGNANIQKQPKQQENSERDSQEQDM